MVTIIILYDFNNLSAYYELQHDTSITVQDKQSYHKQVSFYNITVLRDSVSIANEKWSN